MIFNHLKLGPKFTLLLTIVFLIGVLLSGGALWTTIQHEAEEDITERAELLTQTMNSVRDYTSGHIQPLLQKQVLTEAQFVKETVPSFSARTVFEAFRNRPEYSSFLYKEATPNPTNPENLADAFETKLFEQFRREPDRTVLSGYRTVGNKRLYYTARPLLLQEASCLQCHSTPAVAPKSQLVTYGDKTGFGWHLNDVIAAQTIYVPADDVISHTWHNMTMIMAIFSAIFAIAILAINRLLKRTVVQPIKHLTAIARHLGSNTLTPEQVKDFETPTIAKVAKRQDEPGQLARTFQHMAHEVAQREQMLSRAVEERTAQLAERTQEAQQANQAKSQFLANMSHELRTPLNIILGFSQLMERDRSLDQTQQGYLNTINRSGEHLLGLINNVLDLAKIEAGKMTLHETEVDLNGVLDWVQALFQFKAQSKGIQFVVDRGDGIPNRVCTDEGKLRQVLVNLIGNAIKFTDTGSVRLRVAIEDQQPDTLRFEIEDTGVGIATNELAQLFQPFVQSESGRSTEEGTGLGLAIAQQFVQLMGGKLTAQSQVGVGTIFRFSIDAPFIKTQSRQHQARRQVTKLAPGEPTYRILVADDVAENRQLLVELLKPVGFEVREAATGEAAIDVAQTWRPHLIWMDLRMPGLDGYEATQHIKATIKPAPIVIALTGSAFQEDRNGAVSADRNTDGIADGCDDFVQKPFRTETILKKIADYLGVHYEYASEPDSDLATEHPIQPQPLTPADLAIMTPEWIEQLRQAATRVNAKLILKLIDEIPSEHHLLIQTLTTLVNGFRFAEIVALTRTALST